MRKSPCNCLAEWFMALVNLLSISIRLTKVCCTRTSYRLAYHRGRWMARAIHLLPWNLLVYTRIHVVSTVLLAEMPLDRDSSWTASFAPNVDLQDSSDRTSLLLGANPTSHPVGGSFLHEASLPSLRSCMHLACCSDEESHFRHGASWSTPLTSSSGPFGSSPRSDLSLFPVSRPPIGRRSRDAEPRPTGAEGSRAGTHPTSSPALCCSWWRARVFAELSTCEAAEEEVEEAAGTQAWKKRRTW